MAESQIMSPGGRSVRVRGEFVTAVTIYRLKTDLLLLADLGASHRGLIYGCRSCPAGDARAHAEPMSK